ncbi:MAG TPA: hypothetical protein VJS64_14465 [Pyrinomonadaceae bacterium]|nr:hypothetical protein [Pyrinomonadaceae bacterium]
MIRNAVWLVVFVVSLTGCGKPFDYRDPSDMPKQGGLFSGPDGEFTISSDKKESTKAPAAKSASSSAPEDYREFQGYQEFQRWKASAKDSPEYREFQDWREWKSYRAWKSQQSK